MGDTEKNNVQIAGTGSEEILLEIKKLTKKKLFWQRISACCVAMIAAVALVFALIVLPQIEITLNHVNDTALKAQETLSQAQTMVTSITEASGDFDDLLEKNGEGLTNAVQSLTEIDFEGLNTAIKDLQDAVGPLASFMSKFR